MKRDRGHKHTSLVDAWFMSVLFLRAGKATVCETGATSPRCNESQYVTGDSIMWKFRHTFLCLCMRPYVQAAAGRLRPWRARRRLSMRIMHVEIHPFICRRGSLLPPEAASYEINMRAGGEERNEASAPVHMERTDWCLRDGGRDGEREDRKTSDQRWKRWGGASERWWEKLQGGEKTERMASGKEEQSDGL